MNEITTYTKESIATLKNTQLKKSLTTMLTASNAGRSALWKYARAVHAIITNNTFVDDFESQTAFARYIDVSKSTITNYVKAVDFINREDVKEFFGNDVESLTVGKAYMLSTLDEDDLRDFLDFIEHEDFRIFDISDRALRDTLRELYYEKDSAEDGNDSTESDVADAEYESDSESNSELNVSDSNDTASLDYRISVTAELKNDVIEITIKGHSFAKTRSLTLDEDLLESIKAEYNQYTEG